MTDEDSSALPHGKKSRQAFRTISEVADYLDLPQHVLRFWESKFGQIKPLKRGGNRRYYRPDDVTLLEAIKVLLHAEGYTIKGVQKLFKAQGVKATITQALHLGTGDATSVTEDEVKSEGDDPNISHGALQKLLSDLRTIRASLD